MGTKVVMLQVIQEAGYPDWKHLAKTIFNELIPDDDNEIYKDKIVAWFKYSLDLEEKKGKEILKALVEMGMLSYTTSGYVRLNSKLNSN